MVPPGTYQVRLTASGQTKTESFAIKRNAAVAGVTDADLQAQFELASEIRDRVSQANDTVVRLREMKTQISERANAIREKEKGKKPSKPVLAADALVTALTAIEGEIYQYRNQSSQDPLNFPIKLNNKLAALKATIESADARPTDQSVAVFTELSARLDAELARLDAVMKSDVPAFNKLIAGRRLPPVSDGSPAAAPATRPAA
jgi:predicted  nucleic acid-binding Zn-ribbon protein